MRNAEARVTLGVVALRQGDIEQAVNYGDQALVGDRISLPSLLMCSRELGRAIRQVGTSLPEVKGYLGRLRSIERRQD